MNFVRWDITGFMRDAGKGSWVADRVLLLIVSPLSGGLVAEAMGPLPGEQANNFGKRQGGLGLLGLGGIIGSPGLHELALDEIFLQFLLINDHKLFRENLHDLLHQGLVCVGFGSLQPADFLADPCDKGELGPLAHGDPSGEAHKANNRILSVYC